MATIYGKRGCLVRIAYLLISLLFLPIGLLLCRSGNSVVLCYHGVSDRDQSGFKSQMSWLNWFFLKKGFREDLRQNGLLPVLVTFDDAFRNLVENAVSLVDEYTIPVIIFAVPGNLGTIPGWAMPVDHAEAAEQTMDAQQLHELSENCLITIGSHTFNHENLARLSAREIDQELLSSKEQLEKLLGKTVNELALPYGAYTDEVIEKAISAGYKRIFTLEAEFCSENQDSKVGRFLMSPDVWKTEFILTCIGGYWWLGPWRRFVGRVRSIL